MSSNSTEEQFAAIARRDGALVLSAAAGSGKTSVLVERFVRSVVDDGVETRQILAVTFTEKAAGELRSRVRARLTDLGRRDLAQEAERAAISTIHGFCASVLREHAVEAGLDPDFSVLDDPTARELRAMAFDEALAHLLNGGDAPRPEALEFVAAYGTDRLSRMILEAHDALRGAGRAPVLPARGPAGFPQAQLDALRAACAPALAEMAAGSENDTRDRAIAAVARCGELLAGLAPGALPRTGGARGPVVQARQRHGAEGRCGQRLSRGGGGARQRLRRRHRHRGPRARR